MGGAAGWLLGDKQDVIAIRSLWDGPFLIVNSPGIERGSFGTTAVMPLCTGQRLCPTGRECRHVESSFACAVGDLGCVATHLFFLCRKPHIQSGGISHAELVRLMKVHRCAFQVPDDTDDWILSVYAVSKGNAQSFGGATVRGDDQITVLFRCMRNTEKAEYCW